MSYGKPVSAVMYHLQIPLSDTILFLTLFNQLLTFFPS